MRVIFAGGGTGGHVYPGIALIDKFNQLCKLEKNSACEYLFVGTKHGIEVKICKNENLRLEFIRSRGLMGKGLIDKVKSVLTVLPGLLDSMQVLLRFKPDLVIGLGGYASGPLVLAALLMRKKVVLYEPNLVPGLTNRLLAPYVSMVMLGFSETAKFLKNAKTMITGHPVRQEIADIEYLHACKTPKLLVFGGSSGAGAINRTMVKAAACLKGLGVTIVHQTGEADYETVLADYAALDIPVRSNAAVSGELPLDSVRPAVLPAVLPDVLPDLPLMDVRPYIHDIAEQYKTASLAICRSGAITIAEITAVGMPAVLVPYPYAIYNHQYKNAAVLADNGAAVLIEEENLTAELLSETVLSLFTKDGAKDGTKNSGLSVMSARAAQMSKKDAADRICRYCLEM